MNLKLHRIIKLEGKIVLKSGLHIGAGNESMHIGGTDSPVIKHPHTFEPYIPGSSLKGKTRSLLELESGLVPHAGNDGGLVSLKTWKSLDSNKELQKKAEGILKIFGCSGSDAQEGSPFGPTRVSFADCSLDNEWKKMATENGWGYTEEKSENRIDRIKGVAEHPRQIERVPTGTKFHFVLTFKILDDGEEALFEKVIKGLKLLEMDALGGSGSRGYGRIKFEDLKLNGEDYKTKFESTQAIG